MFLVLPTSKGEYCLNFNKALFFRPFKDFTRIDMEDGTIIDVLITFENLVNLLSQVYLPAIYSNILNQK